MKLPQKTRRPSRFAAWSLAVSCPVSVLLLDGCVRNFSESVATLQLDTTAREQAWNPEDQPERRPVLHRPKTDGSDLASTETSAQIVQVGHTEPDNKQAISRPERKLDSILKRRRQEQEQAAAPEVAETQSAPSAAREPVQFSQSANKPSRAAAERPVTERIVANRPLEARPHPDRHEVAPAPALTNSPRGNQFSAGFDDRLAELRAELESSEQPQRVIASNRRSPVANTTPAVVEDTTPAVVESSGAESETPFWLKTPEPAPEPALEPEAPSETPFWLNTSNPAPAQEEITVTETSEGSFEEASEPVWHLPAASSKRELSFADVDAALNEETVAAASLPFSTDEVGSRSGADFDSTAHSTAELPVIAPAREVKASGDHALAMVVPGVMRQPGRSEQTSAPQRTQGVLIMPSTREDAQVASGSTFIPFSGFVDLTQSAGVNQVVPVHATERAESRQGEPLVSNGGVKLLSPLVDPPPSPHAFAHDPFKSKAPEIQELPSHVLALSRSLKERDVNELSGGDRALVETGKALEPTAAPRGIPLLSSSENAELLSSIAANQNRVLQLASEATPKLAPAASLPTTGVGHVPLSVADPPPLIEGVDALAVQATPQDSGSAWLSLIWWLGAGCALLITALRITSRRSLKA